MDIAFALTGALFVACGAGLLWIAVALPALVPRLRARRDAGAKGAASPRPDPLTQLESSPAAMKVVRAAFAAQALVTIWFGWGFATG